MWHVIYWIRHPSLVVNVCVCVYIYIWRKYSRFSVTLVTVSFAFHPYVLFSLNLGSVCIKGKQLWTGFGVTHVWICRNNSVVCTHKCKRACYRSLTLLCLSVSVADRHIFHWDLRVEAGDGSNSQRARHKAPTRVSALILLICLFLLFHSLLRFHSVLLCHTFSPLISLIYTVFIGELYQALAVLLPWTAFF